MSDLTQKQDIESLTLAFNDFTQIIDRFQKTYDILKSKIDGLNRQLELKNVELETKYAEGENIKNFLKSILENICDGVVVIDSNGRITNFNRAAEMITGFHKEEMVGKNYNFFNKAKNTESRSALYTLTTGKESYHRKKTLLTSDKQEKNVEFSSTLLKDHEGKVLGVVETFNDISEIKLLQEKIIQVETLAALGEMSASIAHEIRNPLAGIMGFAGLLDRQIKENDSKKSLVKSIILGTTKLNDIISNLLTLSRPQQLNLTQININKFLTNLIDYFKESFVICNKKLSFELEVDDPEVSIYLDVQLFQQLMLNLLHNSSDATENEGKISIKTKCNVFEPVHSILEEDEKKELITLFSYIEIEVSDTGRGIPDEVIQKIFNPFFTTKDDGNGLGLAICKKIIQLHRGDIQVKSQIGKGTTFTMHLPLYEQF